MSAPMPERVLTPDTFNRLLGFYRSGRGGEYDAAADTLNAHDTALRAALLAAEARVREVEERLGVVLRGMEFQQDEAATLRAERDALVPLIRAVPDHLCCEDFDHRPPDRHRSGEPCQPYERYRTALTQARAILARETNDG